MHDFLFFVVTLAIVLIVLALALFVLRYNTPMSVYNREVLDIIRILQKNHYQIMESQNETIAAERNIGEKITNINAAIERLGKQKAPKIMRYISRDRIQTERKLGLAEGRRAELAATVALTNLRLESSHEQKSQVERNLAAANEHIEKLLGLAQASQQNHAQLKETVAALEKRIAELEKIPLPTQPQTPTQRLSLTFTKTTANIPPQLPAPVRNSTGGVTCTHNVAPVLPIQSPTLSISPVELVHAEKPMERSIIPDAHVMEKISQLESKLAQANADLQDAKQEVSVAKASASDLQSKVSVMQQEHADELASLGDVKKDVETEYLKLQNRLPTLLEEARKNHERYLQSMFDDDKSELNKDYERKQKELQNELDAAESKLGKVLSEQRKLETDLQQHVQDLKDEQELHGNSKERIIELETRLRVFEEDPTAALTNEQRTHLQQYPTLFLMTHGDGTAAQPSMFEQLRQAQDTIFQQYEEILQQNEELDTLRMTEGALDQQTADQMKEINELTDKCVRIEAELDGLRASTLLQGQKERIPAGGLESAKASEKDAIEPANSQFNDDKDMVAKQPNGKTTHVADDKTTTVAKQNDGENGGNQPQDRPIVSAESSSKKPQRRQVVTNPDISAQEMKPVSDVTQKQCKKCSRWIDFETEHDKSEHKWHETYCFKVICRHEGCGDVMEKDDFHKEHEKPCKARSVEERKKLSLTEAAKLLPRAPDTSDNLERMSILRGEPLQMSFPPKDSGAPRGPSAMKPKTSGDRIMPATTGKGGVAPEALRKPTQDGSKVVKSAVSPSQNSSNAPSGNNAPSGEKIGGVLLGHSRFAPKASSAKTSPAPTKAAAEPSKAAAESEKVSSAPVKASLTPAPATGSPTPAKGSSASKPANTKRAPAKVYLPPAKVSQTPVKAPAAPAKESSPPTKTSPTLAKATPAPAGVFKFGDVVALDYQSTSVPASGTATPAKKKTSGGGLRGYSKYAPQESEEGDKKS